MRANPALTPPATTLSRKATPGHETEFGRDKGETLFSLLDI